MVENGNILALHQCFSSLPGHQQASSSKISQIMRLVPGTQGGSTNSVIDLS